jgi:hypothetical protein
LTLQHGTVTIQLPSPDYDDSLEFSYQKLIRRTQGNELSIVRRSGYEYVPRNTTLKYRFSFLSEITKQSLLSFLNDTVGVPITVTDYKNETWIGIILESDTSNTGRNNNEVTLEIEMVDEDIALEGVNLQSLINSLPC